MIISKSSRMSICYLHDQRENQKSLNFRLQHIRGSVQNMLPLLVEPACVSAFTLVHVNPFLYLYLLLTASMYCFFILLKVLLS